MIVGARQGSLSISETADVLGFSRELAENGAKNRKHPLSSSSAGKNALLVRRRARPVEADRELAVTQITTHYSSGVQKSISEHTKGQMRGS